jgi:hypothetical protein
MIPLPTNTIDETGHTYGLLTVREYAGVSAQRNSLWLCECECGNRIVASSKLLRRGSVVSCGCWRSNPEVRRAARMKTSAKRRREIARMGAAARLTSASISIK